MKIGRDAENRVEIPQDFRIRDVRDIEEKICYLVEFRGFDRIIVDFPECRMSFAEAILPLVCLCQKMTLEGVRFELNLPTLDRLRRLFLNCGWANLIAPKQYRDVGIEMADNIPAVVFRDYTRQDALVNSSIDRVLKRISGVERDNLEALTWSVNEICDNVLNHSQSDIGGIYQLNFRPLSKEVEFIVADAGIGIPESLRPLGNKTWTDGYALEQSVRQGVTRDPDFGQGNGLFGTFKIAALSGGTFHINSGLAHLIVTRNGRVEVRDDVRSFLGTMVVCSVSFLEPKLLERALSFKGNDFKPVDYIELAYEVDDSTMAFVLGREAESMGTRRSGLEIRRKLENLLQMSHDGRLIVDLDQVGVMSSSFADELFAKLALRMGIDQYRQRVGLKNLSEINRQLIQRALSQRLGPVDEFVEV